MEQNFRFSETKHPHQVEHFLTSALEAFQVFVKCILKAEQK